MTGRVSRQCTLALAWLIRTGSTPAQAAARYKLAPSTIRRAMHRAKMPVKPRGRPTIAKTKPIETINDA